MKIETERLIIRSYKDEDKKEALLFLGDEETMYFLPEEVFDLAKVSELIGKQKKKEEYFAVELRETNQVIGHLYFAAFFGDHSYEIGWVFNKQFHSKGYGYEAANAIMTYGFDQLTIHRIIATCQPDNHGSYKLMEKLGMRREGFFKQCIPVKDEWWDEFYYAVLASEW
ncbi:GNAT family N-acetyltransferase [Vagococcus sp. PNs007]|uniref:GNAT family N-acetyltransferase n=1 Tax=Vagococcus proximus TaxID=2991417 RepID=A0ABT5WYN2_9ENTE|nr:GNAT family protein [Vagococcus proximus]MDF0478859.1 GNAT family N-acetyltransferase [Vagococcus proximus]